MIRTAEKFREFILARPPASEEPPKKMSASFKKHLKPFSVVVGYRHEANVNHLILLK